MSGAAAKVNPAVQRNLDRVFAEEQTSTAKLLAQIRLAVALALALTMVPNQSGDAGVLLPSLFGHLLFVSVSVATLLVIRLAPRLARWTALVVPLFDLPMIAVVQAYQADLLLRGDEGLPNAVAIPLALVALSFLSLSRPIIALSAVVATFTITRRLVSLDVFPGVIVISGSMPLGLGLIGSTIVSRVRALVVAARRRDLVGRYVLGERLGVGGMAEVFAATFSPQGGFEKAVAVKVILPTQLERPDAVALFRREAEIGAALAHPNIVQVLDFVEEQDRCYLVLELVKGVPLSKLITLASHVGAPVPIESALWVIEQLTAALDYLHTRTTPTGSPLGLVHRDVNPPNLLISATGEVKLNDFGVARTELAQRLTGTGEVRGKLAYAAPESLQSGGASQSVDVWGLGVTAYEVLTSRRPVMGADDGALVNSILHATIPPVSSWRPEVPLALDSLVQALLQRDPTRRPSPRETLDRLAALPYDRAAARRKLASLVVAAREVTSVPVPTASL